MIQGLIKEYEKREKELKARVAQDSFDSGFTCGQIEMTQAFLKDLRELEGKGNRESMTVGDIDRKKRILQKHAGNWEGWRVEYNRTEPGIIMAMEEYATIRVNEALNLTPSNDK